MQVTKSITALLPLVALSVVLSSPSTLHGQFGPPRAYRRPGPMFQQPAVRFGAGGSDRVRRQRERSGFGSFRAGWEAARARAKTPPWWERSAATSSSEKESGLRSSSGRGRNWNTTFPQDGRVELSYQPPFLPFSISIDSNGRVSVEAKASIVTPIGVFSIGASLPIRNSPGFTYVIVRCRKTGKDSVFKVRDNGERVTVKTDGKATMLVKDRYVFVDVIEGGMKIEFAKLRR